MLLSIAGERAAPTNTSKMVGVYEEIVSLGRSRGRWRECHVLIGWKEPWVRGYRVRVWVGRVRMNGGGRVIGKTTSKLLVM